jgi:hemoglobin/transferrin/lactoferrin receptor protein
MRAFLFILSLFCVCSTWAQTLQILDSKSLHPVVHASILDTVSDQYSWTDLDGKVSLDAFSPQAYFLVQALGYTKVEINHYQLKAGNFKLLLDPNNTELEEVVVSATKWRQPKDKSPLKVISVKSEDIVLQNPQTAADLLGASGAVFIQKSQQGGGSPMIRGFATNRLIYTVDGVRMNTAIFRGGNLQNVISLDALALESAEVLLGPDAVIYGSDAVGGVMSFETLGPKYSENEAVSISANALTRAASANFERTAHAHVQLGQKKWAMTSSFTRTNFGDLRQGNHGPDDYLRPFFVTQYNGQDLITPNSNPNRQVPSGYNQSNFMQKLFYRPHSNWDLSLAYHHSETSAYSRYDRQLRTKNGLPQYGQWDYGPQKWSMKQFTANHFASRGIFSEMTLRLAQQDFEESRISRNFNDPLQENRVENVVAYSANLDLRKNIGQRGELFYGLEWVLDQVESTGIERNILTGTSAPGPSRYPQADWQSYAAYLSYQHQWTPKIMSQAGLRYNGIGLKAEFDTSFYPLPFEQTQLNTDALTGSIGFVFKPSTLWNLRANMATAFRAPNVDDIGKVFDSEPGAVVVPNPDLAPEYALSWDLGVAHMLSKKLKIDLSGYFTQLDNALTRRDFTLNGATEIVYDGVLSRVQAIQNAAEAQVYGIHTGIELKLPSGFELTSDLNWQKGTEEMDDGSTSPARHAAPWFGATRLWFRAQNLVVQGYTQYSGGFSHNELAVEERLKTEIYALDAQGNPYAPGWHTFNVKAQYSLDDHIDLIAGIENITDQRYRTYSSGISAAGRNLILALRAQI